MIFKVVVFLFMVSSAWCKVILIDPGHGGTDFGAQGVLHTNKKQLVFEKNYSLKMATLLRDILQKKHQVYLTRVNDSYISLDARARMADTVKADLFISIHFNSSTDKTAQGIETFYLDNHDDVAVKKVEAVENVELVGKDSIINRILIDLSIKMTTKQSKSLAALVHQQALSTVRKKFHIKDRGAKAGLLYVLALSKRPGVLIEGGFMSHAHEVNKIVSSDFLELYAQGISKGINSYLEK